MLPRETLRLAYIDVLDQLMHLLWSAGDCGEAIPVAHRAIQIDPCHEEAHRLLMRCFAAEGRQMLARRQLEMCRRNLRHTLGVEPSPETVALFTDVLSAGGGP